MKKIVVLMVMLGFASFASAQALQPQPAPTPAPQPSPLPGSNNGTTNNNPAAPACLDGDWVMTGHICSSGVPPWDGFDMNNDRLEADFHTDGSFTTIQTAGNCTVWTSGTYYINNQLLVLQTTQGNSNCGQAQLGNFTYTLANVTSNSFTIYLGPFGPGGECPQGDVLENTFTLWQ